MWQYLIIALEIINLIAVVYIITGIFIENRPVSHLLAWILVFLFVPVVGIIVFILVGRNFRKKRIYKKKKLSDNDEFEKMKCFQESFIRDFFTEKHEKTIIKRIVRLLTNSNKSFLSNGNKVEVLNNGNETFPSIFSSINDAKHFIHLEYYILSDGRIGNELSDILIKKAESGVKVRIIYDDFGSWGLRNAFLARLKKNGIECHAFMPVRIHSLATRINYRNHRKIIVIDGNIGFIGGLNVDDRYLYGDTELGSWRDTHLKITGKAVAALQNIFLNDWAFAGGKDPGNIKITPSEIVAGNSLVQIISSGPDSEWENIMHAFMMMFSNAEKSIYISSPYFFPNESILTSLITASLSGTDVRIILPSKSDSKLATWGSSSYFEQLLEAGIDIYLYINGFTHSKVVIIDDIIASVGTANIDIRSFSYNFEASAIVFDKDVVAKLKKDFESDMENCRKIDYDEFVQRPVKQKIKESTARLFSPLM